jgi:hypothetical protein
MTGEAEAAHLVVLIISSGSAIGGPALILAAISPMERYQHWRDKKRFQRQDRFLHGGA